MVALTTMLLSTGVRPEVGPMPNGSGAAWFFDLRRLYIALAEKFTLSASAYRSVPKTPSRSSGI